MDNNEAKINLFLGRKKDPLIGEWVTIPMDKNKLKGRLNTYVKECGEYIISNVCIIDKSLSSMNIKEDSNIEEINYAISQSLEFIALYIALNLDLQTAIDYYSNNHQYIFIPDVSSISDLGRKIVERGFVEGLTKPLLESGYIDFGIVGMDFGIKGVNIYEGLKAAIGLISQEDFNKWKHILKRPTLEEYLDENCLTGDEIITRKSEFFIEAPITAKKVIEKYYYLYKDLA